MALLNKMGRKPSDAERVSDDTPPLAGAVLTRSKAKFEQNKNTTQSHHLRKMQHHYQQQKKEPIKHKILHLKIFKNLVLTSNNKM
jgi:hypothetical protein